MTQNEPKQKNTVLRTTKLIENQLANDKQQLKPINVNKISNDPAIEKAAIQQTSVSFPNRDIKSDQEQKKIVNISDFNDIGIERFRVDYQNLNIKAPKKIIDDFNKFQKDYGFKSRWAALEYLLKK